MNISFGSLFRTVGTRKGEIEVMYFGRPSEMLLMTSERLPVEDGVQTLGGVLRRLRQRGGHWAYELDDSRLICTVNGKTAVLSDTVAAGDELGIFSRRSLFER